MIDTNIKGLHILTKLFLQDFTKRNRGYILNVASSAAFQPGPLMASYYASKAYVLRLTESIYGELKEIKSNVGLIIQIIIILVL
jgi:short-subunit dehydrogenase